MFEAQILAQNLLGGADNYPLLAVPFFLLAGEIMNEGGLSKRIVEFAMALVGHIRGGLGYVTIVASILLSALSGSAVADAAALTTMLLPMMVAAGHAPHRAAGLIAGSGVIAPVLPPSIGLIIFGVTANVSISKLFMAGIVPGLLMGLSLWITWAIVARNEGLVPPPRKPLRELLVTLRRCGWALMLPVIILVGLRMGVFTPTEAGVVAAVYALFVVDGHLPRPDAVAVVWHLQGRGQDHRGGDVPGGGGHGLVLAHHRGRPARQGGRHARRRSWTARSC